MHPWNKTKLKEWAKAEGYIFSDELPRPGQLYLAGRNTGPHLLTCKEVNFDSGFIVPVEQMYCFNFHECLTILS